MKITKIQRVHMIISLIHYIDYSAVNLLKNVFFLLPFFFRSIYLFIFKSVCLFVYQYPYLSNTSLLWTVCPFLLINQASFSLGLHRISGLFYIRYPAEYPVLFAGNPARKSGLN